jgi:multidrug resistance protein
VPKVRALLVVFFTLFLDLLGFGLIIPVSPFYAESFGASPAAITALGASYSLAQLLFAPVWGRLSDRLGRRPVMLVSIACAGAGYALFALSTSYEMLLLTRILSGIGTANIATAQAMVADLTTRETRSRGMALVGVAFGLGFVIGPAVGGVAASWGLAAPAWIACGLSAANLLLALFLLPETRPVAPTARAGWGALVRRSMQEGWWRLVGVYLLVTTGFALLEQILGLWIAHTWAPDAVARGRAAEAVDLTTWVLVTVGVTAVLVQGGLVPFVSRRLGERGMVLVGVALQAALFVAFPWISAVGIYEGLLVGAVGLALGSGLTNPGLSAWLSLSGTAEDQGSTLSLGQSASALGRVVGPAAAGLLFQRHVDLPFWVGAGLLVLGLLLAVSARPPRANPAPAP